MSSTPAAASRKPLMPWQEWPTWLLIAAVYGRWLLAVRAATLPGWSSLMPLAVWHPYGLFCKRIFCEAHLAHHRDERLTQPGLDPESNSDSGADYEKSGSWLRPLRVAQRSVVGRVLLGPAMVIAPVWLDIVRKPWRGDFRRRACGPKHLLHAFRPIDSPVYPPPRR